MKFTKPFLGVKNGEIYPTEFNKGDDCPPELETAAIEANAVGKLTKAEIKAAEDAAKKEAEAKAAEEAAKLAAEATETETPAENGGASDDLVG